MAFCGRTRRRGTGEEMRGERERGHEQELEAGCQARAGEGGKWGRAGVGGTRRVFGKEGT